tara:strand:- start:26388 stop:29147 length:2760 start_codon:yes stop_codon:yes gene_type:complete
MKSRTSVVLLLSLILLQIAASLPAQDEPYRARPIPAGEDVYTMRSLDRDHTAMWRELLLADCKATGALADPWREDLEQLCEVYSEVYGLWQMGNEQYERAYKLAERLERKECNLPLAQLAIGDAHTWQGRLGKAAAPYAEVAKVQAKHSPAFRMMFAQSRNRLHLQRSEADKARQANNDALAALIDIAAADGLPKRAERFLLIKVMTLNAWQIDASSADFIDRLEKRVGKHHYTVLVLRAKLHNHLAWNARGQGTASSITEKNFGTFADHITKSAEYAAEATKRFPQHPEGPSAMMSAIGPAGGDAMEMRRWFDLAVASQFDWDDAYRTYLHFLQPRWGGSMQALIKLGKECIDTGRFDTSVPANYRLAVHYIALDSRSPLQVWAKSSVQKRLDMLDQGMIAAAATRRAQWNANTHHVMALTLGGKFEEAVKLYERWGKSVDPRHLEIYGVSEDWLHKTLRPFVSGYQPAKVAQRDLFAGFEQAKGFLSARPLKSHRDASTAVEYDAKWRRWINESFVAAYREKGAHDDDWDTDAEKLLSSFGRVADGDITRADVTVAVKLLEAGCKDPLVNYVIVRTLEHVELDQRLELLDGLLPRLQARYPITFSWWGQFHCQELLRMYGAANQAGAMESSVRSHIVRATADAICGGNGRRQYVRALWGSSPFVQPGPQWFRGDAIEELNKVEGADPWLSNFVRGHYHAHSARYPKGTMIQRVGDIKQAAQHLREAWRIAPENPEAATVMIVVAMLDAEAAGGTPREWFDRAVGAQIDYAPAYNAFVDTLRPKNGGSIQAMYRFAVECLESGRFDTVIPLWFAFTLERIHGELDEPREAWAAGGVGERLDAMFDGYLKRKEGSVNHNYLRAGRCMTTWAAGDYDRALSLWREAGEQLDRRWLKIIGVEELDLVEADLKFLAAKAGKK